MTKPQPRANAGDAPDPTPSRLRLRLTTVEDVRRERDRLNQLLEEIYKGAPRTDGKAYAAAQKALKADQELFFSDSELDHMLPQRLRSQRR